MERHVTFTSETDESVTCSVYDVEATLTAWYPDAPAEVTEGIAELARTLVAERYPETSALDAPLGLSWEWAHPLDSAEAAEHLGVSVATLYRYRSTDPSFPAPVVTLRQSDGWWAPDLDAWQAQRPGQGVGGGRPRKG